MTENCVFCEWEKGDRSNFWGNELFFSRFDNFPVSPGHAQIIPRRHIADLGSLNSEEWILLQQSLKEVVGVIENTDLKNFYHNLLKDSFSDLSAWFCRKAVEHPRINTKPDAYNHGINDGRAAGRTVDHFHWHIIPRFTGDMVDPRGGVRYVIPVMGNYKIPR